MLNWNVLVKSRNNAEAARNMLAKELYPENPNCLDSTDLEFVNNQDYITAVPVEISLTVDERKAVRKANPETRWIVTGVGESDVTNLVVNYGYKVLEPEVKVPVKSDIESKSSFKINGKEVSEEEWLDGVKRFSEEFNKVWNNFRTTFDF